MKTEPTALDREAATLFTCTDGMRAGWCYTSVTAIPPKQRCLWERICQDGKTPDVIDTDDPATVGCMLAQVEEALDAAGCPGAYLHPWNNGWAVRRGMAIRRYPGPTRGAALVSAMRALKGAK